MELQFVENLPRVFVFRETRRFVEKFVFNGEAAGRYAVGLFRYSVIYEIRHLSICRFFFL